MNNTLDDINYLMDPNKPYGLIATQRIFQNEKNLNFSNAGREWRGIGEIMLDRLLRKHGISDSGADGEMHLLPMLSHVENVYHTALSQMPKTIEECRAVIASLVTTLTSIKLIDEAVPLTEPDANEPFFSRLRQGRIEMKHLEEGFPSLPRLEKESVGRWNKRRVQTKSKPMTPMTKLEMAEILLSRNDVSSTRIYPNGENSNVGLIALRKPQDDQTYLDLIDFQADDVPGLGKYIAALALYFLTIHKRLELRCCLEETHA